MFGYINGLVEGFTDDSIAASLEKDKLLERYFECTLVEIEKYFRFNSVLQIYETAVAAGKIDAQFFKDNSRLPKLEDYLNQTN